MHITCSTVNKKLVKACLFVLSRLQVFALCSWSIRNWFPSLKLKLPRWTSHDAELTCSQAVQHHLVWQWCSKTGTVLSYLYLWVESYAEDLLAQDYRGSHAWIWSSDWRKIIWRWIGHFICLLFKAHLDRKNQLFENIVCVCGFFFICIRDTVAVLLTCTFCLFILKTLVTLYCLIKDGMLIFCHDRNCVNIFIKIE